MKLIYLPDYRVFSGLFQAVKKKKILKQPGDQTLTPFQNSVEFVRFWAVYAHFPVNEFLSADSTNSNTPENALVPLVSFQVPASLVPETVPWSVSLPISYVPVTNVPFCFRYIIAELSTESSSQVVFQVPVQDRLAAVAFGTDVAGATVVATVVGGCVAIVVAAVVVCEVPGVVVHPATSMNMQARPAMRQIVVNFMGIISRSIPCPEGTFIRST